MACHRLDYLCIGDTLLLTSTMLAMLRKAVGKPGYIRHGWTIHEWDISGNCTQPVTRELLSRPLQHVGRGYTYGPGSEKAMSLILHTRCRHCDACRRVKQGLWTYRAVAEVRDAARTWFGTLTLRPEAQYQLECRTRAKLASRAVDFDTLSRETQFRELTSELGKEVTLYLKRVRKESGARLRYLLVAEAHESGQPHLHILVHEADVNQPVRYSTLAKQWKLGFVRFKLALDTNTARYVCKYIAKAMIARVRASLRYGSESVEENGLSNSSAKESVVANAPQSARSVGRAEGRAEGEDEDEWSELCDCTRKENTHVMGFRCSQSNTTISQTFRGEGYYPSEVKHTCSPPATGKRQCASSCKRQRASSDSGCPF